MNVQAITHPDNMAVCCCCDQVPLHPCQSKHLLNNSLLQVNPDLELKDHVYGPLQTIHKRLTVMCTLALLACTHVTGACTHIFVQVNEAPYSTWERLTPWEGMPQAQRNCYKLPLDRFTQQEAALLDTVLLSPRGVEYDLSGQRQHKLVFCPSCLVSLQQEDITTPPRHALANKLAFGRMPARLSPMQGGELELWVQQIQDRYPNEEYVHMTLAELVALLPLPPGLTMAEQSTLSPVRSLGTVLVLEPHGARAIKGHFHHIKSNTAADLTSAAANPFSIPAEVAAQELQADAEDEKNDVLRKPDRSLCIVLTGQRTAVQLLVSRVQSLLRRDLIRETAQYFIANHPYWQGKAITEQHLAWIPEFGESASVVLDRSSAAPANILPGFGGGPANYFDFLHGNMGGFVFTATLNVNDPDVSASDILDSASGAVSDPGDEMAAIMSRGQHPRSLYNCLPNSPASSQTTQHMQPGSVLQSNGSNIGPQSSGQTPSLFFFRLGRARQRSSERHCCPSKGSWNTSSSSAHRSFADTTSV